MPEEKSKKTVDIDTSGPGAEVDVAEEKVKEEGVVETEAKEPEIKEEETETVDENDQYTAGVDDGDAADDLDEAYKVIRFL